MLKEHCSNNKDKKSSFYVFKKHSKLKDYMKSLTNKNKHSKIKKMDY
jgi:hypothetical protein